MNSKEKFSDNEEEEFSSPRKRSRPSLAQRLGLTDDSDQSDSQSQSPRNDQFNPNILPKTNLSLRESIFNSSEEPHQNILQLLQDDEDEEEEEAYSPSQLDPATMDEVSQQLKRTEKSSVPSLLMKNYIPPSSQFPHEDIDYREKKKSTELRRKSNELVNVPCRLIPIHGECPTVIDPRLRIHSLRLRAKVRQLVFERLSTSETNLDRNEIVEELDHLVESHGRRLYWYRVICFLQNISLTNNSPKQIHSYLKELSRLLILTPTISTILKIKQKYPKSIPIQSKSTHADPRSKTFQPKFNQWKFLRYH